MTYQELREKAEKLLLSVESPGVTGNSKLWAMYCNVTGKRVSGYYTLAEWQEKDIHNTCLDYIADKAAKQLGIN